MAVYEPVDAAEITFAQPNVSLRSAADEYCEKTRDRGLAQGESTLGGLAGALLGKDSAADKYWAAVSESAEAGVSTVDVITVDLTNTTLELEELTGLALELINSGEPARTDVNKFESALIHARQSRQSLYEAIQKVGGDTATAGELKDGLGSLDRAIQLAVQAADRLAEARTANSIAQASSNRAAG